MVKTTTHFALSATPHTTWRSPLVIEFAPTLSTKHVVLHFKYSAPVRVLGENDAKPAAIHDFGFEFEAIMICVLLMTSKFVQLVSSLLKRRDYLPRAVIATGPLG
eukprot:6172061-Pleurochrysis_carterae.AAC.1